MQCYGDAWHLRSCDLPLSICVSNSTGEGEKGAKPKLHALPGNLFWAGV